MIESIRKRLSKKSVSRLPKSSEGTNTAEQQQQHAPGVSGAPVPANVLVPVHAPQTAPAPPTVHAPRPVPASRPIHFIRDFYNPAERHAPPSTNYSMEEEHGFPVAIPAFPPTGGGFHSERWIHLANSAGATSIQAPTIQSGFTQTDPPEYNVVVQELDEDWALPEFEDWVRVTLPETDQIKAINFFSDDYGTYGVITFVDYQIAYDSITCLNHGRIPEYYDGNGWTQADQEAHDWKEATEGITRVGHAIETAKDRISVLRNRQHSQLTSALLSAVARNLTTLSAGTDAATSSYVTAANIAMSSEAEVADYMYNKNQPPKPPAT